MTDNSDYSKPRTNLLDLLPEVYRSDVNESLLETTLNRFLTKTELQRIIGFIGQGNPNALIDRQIKEQEPHRQAFQLQPIIFNQIGTVEHMASSRDIFNELERLGVDLDRMKEWGNATKFNWAPPVDYDKLVNFSNYYWVNSTNIADPPQYLTIQNPCNRGEAQLAEYENTKIQFGVEHTIIGLDASKKEIIIQGDLTLLMNKGFVFFVKNSTNTSINDQFFTVESSSTVVGQNATSIIVNVSVGSPVFSNVPVDGVVSLEELTSVFEAARDLACGNPVGWDGGLWDDNQLGSVIWNTQLLLDISAPTLAARLLLTPSVAKFDLWYDTAANILKQFTDGSPPTVVSLQSNFSAVLDLVTGNNFWDADSTTMGDLNAWQEQNMWIHRNQVTNFTTARQAQIPIIEFLPTVQLNEWSETVYQWQYRANPASDNFATTNVIPHILELAGIPAADGSPFSLGYKIQSSLTQLHIDPSFGDLTNIFTVGYQFRLNADTLTVANGQTYTVESAIYCETALGQKLQTIINVTPTTPFIDENSNGILLPAVTSLGDGFIELHEHWLFGGIQESLPVIRQPINPMTPLSINPPPVQIPFTTNPTGSPVVSLGTYGLSFFAQEITFTTDSFSSLQIIGVDGSPRVWTVAGNHAEVINNTAFNITLLNVSNNLGGGVNGIYTIVSAVDTGANTDITVAEVIPSTATVSGSINFHWTLTFDTTLQNQTRFQTQELRIYLDDIRQFGTYIEINSGAGTSSPVIVGSCDDFVNSIVVQNPIPQFSILRIEVGAAAGIDIGYENIQVRVNPNDLSFDPVTDLQCVSLVRYKKLEQVKTQTNQYPLFDLYNVNGTTLNRADRIFEFQEQQTSPINAFVGKRILITDNGRTFTYEQSLLDEDNGIIFAYRDTSDSINFQFWYDTDDRILYRWTGETWDTGILTEEFAIDSGSPGLAGLLNCYLRPIISDDTPGQPFLGINGMIWFNTGNNTINVSNGFDWIEDPILTSQTKQQSSDPTLQTIWRTGPTTGPCDKKEMYFPSYVDANRFPILHHAIVGVVPGSPGTITLIDKLTAKDRFEIDVTLLEVGDIITINNNLDTATNGNYTVTNIIEDPNGDTVDISVASIPTTATISGFVTRIGDAVGDWEIPDQLYFNVNHENRKVLTSTDLLAHLLTIIADQEVPSGLFGSATNLYHAITDINFGKGGTIKEHNFGYDTFLSSIFIQNVNPIALYEFGHDSYESSLAQIKEIYRQNITTLMTDVSEAAIAQLGLSIATSVINTYEQNDFNNLVFGDSNTFNQGTGLGVRNWPATLPFIQLQNKVQPILLDDPIGNINSIRHHDGHLSDVGFLATTINLFALQIINTVDTRITNPSGVMGNQSSLIPPVLFSGYSAVFGNTVGGYWYQVSANTRTLSRLTVIRIGGSGAPPSTSSFPLGSYWYDTTADRLKVLTAVGSPVINSWENATTLTGVLTEGAVTAWKVIDINQILAEIILEVENRLYAVAPTLTSLSYDIDSSFTTNPDISDEYLRQSFFEFLAQARIQNAFINEEFDATDPFTWNYKDSVPQVAFTDKTYVSGGTWEDVYTKRYNTPYPHLEPWKLQGFLEKPIWWDATYKDTTGTRRWIVSTGSPLGVNMWQNILDGIVPVGESLPNGDISTGVAGEVQDYLFVSVNIDTITHDGFAPDALFPPFWTFNHTIGGFFTTSVVRSIFFNEGAEIINISDAFIYDDAGLVEWQWENSSQFLYDRLKVAFRIDPIKFIFQTLGETFTEIGCLQISQDLQKVFRHQDARFHGDILPDNTGIILPGTLQWYVNFNRFNGYDGSASNFRPMWTQWNTFLGYQTATFIDNKSLIVFNRNFDITTQDFTTRIKRSPGIEDHFIDALNITINQAPGELGVINADSRWVVTFDTFSPQGRQISYYATQSYNFNTVTTGSPSEISDIMTINDTFGRVLPWSDGDSVVVTSTQFLPSPLIQDRIYFVNVITATTFSLSETNGGPTVDILTAGSGTLNVAKVDRSFKALNGDASNNKIFYAYELDTDLVLTLLPPQSIQGLQNLINIIFGYAGFTEQVDNFNFNHQSTDIDPDTSRVINWQLEIERLIEFAFNARRSDHQIRNFYEFNIMGSPKIPTFLTNTQSGILEAPRWITGQKVVVFSTGGDLPDPLLTNNAYYIIRLSDETFQLALTLKNARNGIAIALIPGAGSPLFGSGSFFVQELVTQASTRSQEVNPFRNNLWIRTPQGIVSDLVRGPFADVRTDHALFDQFGRQLPTDRVVPLREDKLTQILIQDGIVNDLTPDLSGAPNPYNFIHLTSAHIFVDGYEHVILFNARASDGSLIYDSFIGLNTPKFDVQFDRSPEFTLRPNVGGYVLLNQQNIDFSTTLVRNIEGQAEDLRFMYDTYQSLEVNNLVSEVRESLGYDGPFDFLSAININPKSQFIFWRGLIQAKGSVNSILAFINSRRFIDARIDEFWSYKVADFGDNSEFNLPEVNLFANDTRSGEIRLHFVDTPGTADTGFLEVLPNDENRWFELPNQEEFFTSNGNMYFNTGIDSIDVTPLDYISGQYIELPIPVDDVTITDAGGNLLQEGTDYTFLNSETLDVTVIGSPGDLKIFMHVPYESRHNPCKIRDILEEVTVADVILWDPRRNNHYHNAIHIVDVQRDTDPVLQIGQYEFDINVTTGVLEDKIASTFNPWGQKEVHTTWLDTNEVGYLPYSDNVLNPNILDRLKSWGRLADWSSYKLYQWTESNVPPDEYDALAIEQEGDFTIDSQIRVNGRVRKQLYILDGSSFAEYKFETIHFGSKLYFSTTVDFAQPNLSVVGNPTASTGSPLVETPRFKAYKNGVEFVGPSASPNDGYYYGTTNVIANTKFSADLTTFTDSDIITLVKFQPTGDEINSTFFLERTPYSTEQIVTNGIAETKYYFWVTSKTVRQTERKKEVSMVEAANQLEAIPVPYVVAQGFEPILPADGSPVTASRPRRYTQAILRNYGSLINADDRYVLRFTRNFVLRDDLFDTTDGSARLKTIHQEWELFRKEQAFNIPRGLWDLMTESIIGQTLTSLTSTAIRVPALNRELFDIEHDTSTRIGIAQSGQAFCDGERAWDAILQFLQDGDNDFTPVDIQTFFTTHDILNLTPRSADDAAAIATMLNEIFNTFPFTGVNRMFFQVLETAAIPFQKKYEDILKTSWLALHGIKVLEVAGIFDD